MASPVGAYCAFVDAARTGTDHSGTGIAGPSLPWPVGAGLILLSGGGSRRLGRDKATTHVGGQPILTRLLGSVPPTVAVVLVGPRAAELPDHTPCVREDPPGSGPLAAIGAGLGHLTGTSTVGVLAADMPFAAPVVAAALAKLAGSPDAEAVIPTDPGGHRQPLAAAYRTAPLLRALAELGPLPGLPVRAMLQGLRVMEWPVPAPDLLDVDTTTDLNTARTRTVQEGAVMQEWVAAASQALGLDITVDLDVILDVARDAAHAVERPAAPVTTFLLGVAVARGADPAAAAQTISELAAQWADSR